MLTFSHKSTGYLEFSMTLFAMSYTTKKSDRYIWPWRPSVDVHSSICNLTCGVREIVNGIYGKVITDTLYKQNPYLMNKKNSILNTQKWMKNIKYMYLYLFHKRRTWFNLWNRGYIILSSNILYSTGTIVSVSVFVILCLEHFGNFKKQCIMYKVRNVQNEKKFKNAIDVNAR